ncbi:MAG: hypothetical protein IIX99_02765 [Oscillospiraceae bacterium]|nr:hypothetical protein [Oscillospiraceae bacterium]
MKKNTQRKYGANAVVGNLAFDFDYVEREELKREREERRAAERHMNESVRVERKKEAAPAPERKQRERQSVSGTTVLGFTALAAAVLMVILSYAQLTAISGGVVEMQRELRSLEEQHVTLLSEYEQTFDLSAVKEAAEAAGMYKPSSSQVYYMDLSAPDSVQVFQSKDTSVLSRIFTSFGQGVVSAVEYFS